MQRRKTVGTELHYHGTGMMFAHQSRRVFRRIGKSVDGTENSASCDASD
jgi:hypothetical protein